jgi:hypothetical protein
MKKFKKKKYNVKKARRVAENLHIQSQARWVMAKVYRELGNYALAKIEYEASLHDERMAIELWKDIILHDKVKNFEHIMKETSK